jgi:hypothetical protein
MEILKFQMDFRVHMKHMKNINEHKFWWALSYGKNTGKFNF